MPDRLSHLFLPPLVESANVQEPTDPGHWQNNERRVLAQIANGIVVDQQAKERGISSVPDPWARPLTVQSAVAPQSRHPLQEQITTEWRGLLSLLALRRVRGHDVTFAPVQLDRGRMAEALRRLAPRPVLLEPGTPYAWTDVLLVRYNGTPIGALSPTTLAYTAADYADAIRETDLNLQQRDEEGRKTGLLAPPTEREDLEYVAEWVDGLVTSLGAMLLTDDRDTRPAARRGVEAARTINALLSGWLAELKDALGIDALAPADARDVRVATDEEARLPDWEPLDSHAVWRRVLTPLVLDDGEIPWGNRSDLALDLQPDRNHSAVDEVVVVTRKLLKGNPRVWRARRFSHLGGDVDRALGTYFAGASGTLIGDEPMSVKEGDREWRAMWVRPERYFLTDTLVQAPGGDPLLSETERQLNEGRGGRYLLPFRREILDFFGPEAVRDQLRPQFVDVDNGVLFSFSLPVGGRDERIERIYRHKDAATGEGTILKRSLPVVELFPTYLGPAWRRYWLMQEADGTRVRPVVYGDARTAERLRETDPAAGEPERRAWLVEMAGDDAFPDGLAIEGADGDAQGLVLVGRNRPVSPGLSGSWTVGVDFGTSNTNVFRRSSESDRAERWTFDFPRLLRPIANADGPKRSAYLETFFVPNERVELPVPTTLRLFESTQRDRAVLDFFILFSSRYRLPATAYSNLKWDQTDRLTEFFLESLMTLVLLDAVDQDVAAVDVLYSYPKAYSAHQKAVVEAEWEHKVFQRLFEGDRRVLTRKSGSESRIDVTLREPVLEGVAAGEFFASELTIDEPLQVADKHLAALALDVGGGTTDVSLWHRDRIAFDASVLLAGEQIATYLMRTPRVREFLFSPDAALALDEVDTKPKEFAARLNLILKREEDAVRGRLIEHVNRRDVVWLRQLIAFEFAAIAYYAAALLGAADKTPDGRGVLDQIAKTGIKLHWGGNAAKLITWIDLGTYKTDGLAARLLSGVFFQGLKDLDVRPDQLAQLQSPGHKSEAAGGLVVMPDPSTLAAGGDGAAGHPYELDLDAPASSGSDFDDFVLEEEASVAESVVVTGETIRVAGRELDFTDSVSNADLYDGTRTRFEGSSLQRLTRFVQVFNAFGVKFGLFPEDMKIPLDRATAQHIGNKMQRAFTDAEKLGASSRILEPMFITEIKELMKVLIADRK